MRIYDLNSEKKFDKVTLYLTPEEARELKDSLELLLNNKAHHHEHIPDRESDFKREITVCIYTEDNLSSFDERSRRLILTQE
ncbi:MAG: hypothetical protein HYX48_07000 [Chlamydiales bacterium]|nr:hypothetical protein [Chlamydiales bacterium]